MDEQLQNRLREEIGLLRAGATVPCVHAAGDFISNVLGGRWRMAYWFVADGAATVVCEQAPRSHPRWPGVCVQGRRALAYLAEGCTNAELCAVMGLDRQAILGLLMDLGRRLNADDRADLIARAQLLERVTTATEDVEVGICAVGGRPYVFAVMSEQAPTAADPDPDVAALVGLAERLLAERRHR